MSLPRTFAVLLLLLGGCKKATEEDRVRAVIHKAVAAADEKRAGEVVADAAPAFKGPQGAPVDECRRILTGYFLGAGWVRTFQRSLAVQVEGERATAKLLVVVAQGEEVKKLEDVVPTRAAELEFTLALEKQGGEWRFVEADYRQLGR